MDEKSRKKLKISKRLDYEAYTVAVVCAMSFEMSAVRYMLDEEHSSLPRKDGDSNTYILGELSGHNVIIACLPGVQGKGAAAVVATNMQRTFQSIQWRLLVGIGGGVPSNQNDIRLGDVVVSMPCGQYGGVVQYDLGQDTEGGFNLKGFLAESPSTLRSAVEVMRSDHLVKPNKVDEFLTAMLEKNHQLSCYKRPSLELDILFSPEYAHELGQTTCQSCDKSKAVSRDPREFDAQKIHYGLIASGDRVIKSATIRDSISRDFNDILCFEMEAAGLMTEFSCLVIRGISDYADSHKNGNWQYHAAAGAAACAKEILSYLDLKVSLNSQLSVPKHEFQEAPIPYSNYNVLSGQGFQNTRDIFIGGSVTFGKNYNVLSGQGFQNTRDISIGGSITFDPRSVPKQPVGPWFLVPYPENDTFVGRTSILGKLQLLPLKSTSQARVSLFGLGGIGKTQIALAYVYWLLKAYPDVSVFWVHASNAERFCQSFTSISQECYIPGHDDPKVDVLPMVKRWLERKDQGWWLMVLDNADDAQLFFPSPRGPKNDSSSNHENGLGQYIPECAHGSILITTRNKQAGLKLAKGRPPIEIGTMDDGESEQLLRANLGEGDVASSELLELSSRLEHLPLALVQAAAFIEANSVSVSKYLQLLNKSDQGLVDLLSEEFETVGRDSETPRAVAETWILSFEQIEQQHTFAGKLLSLISFLDRQAIPLAFLAEYGQSEEESGEINLQKALGILKAFSFVTVGKDQSLDVHRLVQLVTRKWLARRQLMGEFAGKALLAVLCVYPFGDYKDWVLCRAYLPHADAVLRFEGTGSRDEEVGKADLSYRVARFFIFQNQWKDAERFQQEAFKLNKRVLGEEHPMTLASMSTLALIYSNQARWKEAESLFMQAIETSMWVLGEEAFGTLTSMGNLASMYTNHGRWREAESLLLRVIELGKRVFGEEHPSTLTDMANLATTYSKQGRWKEAETLTVQIMDTRKRVSGEENPSTLTSMADLAMSYKTQGQWKKAELMYMQVIDIEKRVLGEEHPSTLITIDSLASTFWDQGRWEEAESLSVQVMETFKRVLGEEHPNTLTCTGNLATTFYKQGRWKEAETLTVQVMDASKRVLGEDHPCTLICMDNLASTYSKQGRWKEAELLLMQVIETGKGVLGEEHPDMLISMGNLESMFCNQGRWKEAEALAVQIMDTRKRVLGEENPLTLTSMANLALTYKEQGRWKEAELLFMQVIETRKRVLGEEHSDMLISMGNLVLMFCNQGRWKEAETLAVQEIDIRKRVFGDEHSDTLTNMVILALIYGNQGRWKDAELLEVEVMGTMKRVLGDEHPETLTSMAYLAWIYRKQDRWKEAESLFLQVIELGKRVLGEEHPDMLASMARLALVYKKQDRWKEAESLYLQVIELGKRVLGEEHPAMLASMDHLAWIYSDQGRWKEAESLFMPMMETLKMMSGEEHADRLTSMANLASKFRNEGRWEEAEKLEVQVMETRKAKLGVNHPDTLTSMANLAFTWKSCGRHADALALMDDCAQVR